MVKSKENNYVMKAMSAKLEDIVRKVIPNLDVMNCKTEEEVVFKSLNAI